MPNVYTMGMVGLKDEVAFVKTLSCDCSFSSSAGRRSFSVAGLCLGPRLLGVSGRFCSEVHFAVQCLKPGVLKH